MSKTFYTQNLIVQERLNDWITSSVSALIRLKEAKDTVQCEKLSENAQIVSDIIKDSLGLTWVSVGYYSNPVVSFTSKTRPGTFFEVSLQGKTWTLSQVSCEESLVLLRTSNPNDLIDTISSLLRTCQ